MKLQSILQQGVYTENVDIPKGLVEGLTGAVLVVRRLKPSQHAQLSKDTEESDDFETGRTILDAMFVAIEHDGERLEVIDWDEGPPQLYSFAVAMCGSVQADGLAKAGEVWRARQKR